jgi:hypothetical protein
VTITCGTMTLTGSVTVATGTTPIGGAKTGDGASILGSGTNDAAGIALLGGALGLGAMAVRRKAKAGR